MHSFPKLGNEKLSLPPGKMAAWLIHSLPALIRNDILMNGGEFQETQEVALWADTKLCCDSGWLCTHVSTSLEALGKEIESSRRENAWSWRTIRRGKKTYGDSIVVIKTASETYLVLAYCHVVC